MSWLIDWATWSARFWLKNHMTRTHPTPRRALAAPPPPFAHRKLASEVRPRQQRQVRQLTAVTFLQNDALGRNHHYPANGLTMRSAPLRERFRDFATRSMASATSESRTCA